MELDKNNFSVKGEIQNVVYSNREFYGWEVRGDYNEKTASISQKHNFERRISMYSAYFDEDGILYSTTKYGDYPMLVPDKKITDRNDLFAGLMLLSYNKKVQVSSTTESLYAENMVDEDIRTYRAAETGNKSEYAIIVESLPFQGLEFLEKAKAICPKMSIILLL